MKESLDKLTPVLMSLKRYLAIIAIVSVGGIYAYMIVSAGAIAERDPSQTEVGDAYKKSNRPKINEIVVNKITELQDQNVQFQSLIDEARDNPFVEE